MRATRWFPVISTMVLGLLLDGCAPAGVAAVEDTPETGPPGAPECATMNRPSASRTIGANGGSLVAAQHRLIIPPGALKEFEERTFTMVHPPRNYVVVTLGPSGTQFETPAELQLSFAHCEGLDASVPLAIYRWSGREGWVKLESRHDRAEQEVEAPLNSLSSYALGAG